MKWKVPEQLYAFFSVDCFGDGSCSAVGEVCRDPARRLLVGRHAYGALPGPIQTSMGADLFALLHWLHHLDPLSRPTPRFFTDNQRMADGYNGCWAVTDPWVEHRDLLDQVLACKADVWADAVVIWTPRAVSSKSIVGGDAALQAFGNSWADRTAKAARLLHSSPR